jgi:hypothetical protein
MLRKWYLRAAEMVLEIRRSGQYQRTVISAF